MEISNSSAQFETIKAKVTQANRRPMRVIFGLFVLYLLFKSIFVFVPPGHVGVYYDRGRGVLPDVADEGLALKIPFWQRI